MNQTKMALLSTILLVVTLSSCGIGGGSPEGPETSTGLPSGVETSAKEALTARTGVSVEEIEIVEAEQREWPDACLGLAEEGEACAEVITPGWEVTLRAEGEEYILRTDEAADVIRVEE